MDSTATNFSRPDVLSRGALEMTFQLLRKNNATLALDIQEQLHAAQIRDPSQRKDESRPLKDHYKITLNPRTVGLIVDALTKLGERYLRAQESHPQELHVIRSLIDEWAGLAEWLLSRAEPHTATLH